MENYTTIDSKILEELKKFIANITKCLGKVDTHFIRYYYYYDNTW